MSLVRSAASVLVIEWSRVRYFKWEEFGCQACVRPELVYRLDDARELAGIPFVISSAYRVGDIASHGRGYGADIRIRSSLERYRVLGGVIEAGFTRIGIYDRHIHVDVDPALPTGVVWIGKSR